eukprot:TRINITY_DN5284_c0_g1_i2.p1 TRINITY_DN5284_c0_g1~~TRINITY_DN5284_c0_g1_i2.p1  ORF type:complete len:245 (-),score=74.42 TRINITY_DN5284_c0_g1_i2:54-788(-)
MLDSETAEAARIANFLFSSNLTSQIQYQLANSVSKVPVLAMVFQDNLGDSHGLYSFKGNIGLEGMISELVNAMDTNSHLLDNARESQLERDFNRQIRAEQDKAYLESLQRDQEKEATTDQSRTEADLFAKLEDQIRGYHETELQKRKRRKAEQLSEEPPDNMDGNSISRIVVRLLDGTKIQRRFSTSENLQSVMDFIDTRIETDIEGYELVTNFPNKTYSDLKQTILECGLYPQALMFLKEKLR